MSKNLTNRFKRLRQITLLSSLLSVSSLAGSNLTFGVNQISVPAGKYEITGDNVITSNSFGTFTNVTMDSSDTNYQLGGNVIITKTNNNKLELNPTSYFTTSTANTSFGFALNNTPFDGSNPIIQGMDNNGKLVNLAFYDLTGETGETRKTFVDVKIKLSHENAAFTSKFGTLASVELSENSQTSGGTGFYLESQSKFKGAAEAPDYDVVKEKLKDGTYSGAHKHALEFKGHDNDSALFFTSQNQTFSLKAADLTSIAVEQLNFTIINNESIRNITDIDGTVVGIIGVKFANVVLDHMKLTPIAYYTSVDNTAKNIIDFPIEATGSYIKNLDLPYVGLGIAKASGKDFYNVNRTAAQITNNTVSPDKITVGGVILPITAAATPKLLTSREVAFSNTSTILKLYTPLHTTGNMFDLSKAYDMNGKLVNGAITDNSTTPVNLMSLNANKEHIYAKFEVKANGGIKIDENTTVKYGDQFPTGFAYNLGASAGILQNPILEIKPNSVGAFGIFNDGTAVGEVGINNPTIKGNISDLKNMQLHIGSTSDVFSNITAKLNGILTLDGYINKDETGIDSSINTFRTNMTGNQVLVGTEENPFETIIPNGTNGSVVNLAFYGKVFDDSDYNNSTQAKYFLAENQKAGFDITIDGDTDASQLTNHTSITISGEGLQVPALKIAAKDTTAKKLGRIELLGSQTYDYVDVKDIAIYKTVTVDVTFNNAIYDAKGNKLSYAQIEASAAAGGSFKKPHHRTVDGGIEEIAGSASADQAVEIFDLSDLGTMVPKSADNVVTVKNIGGRIKNSNAASTNDNFYDFSAMLPNLHTTDLSNGDENYQYGYQKVNLDFATNNAEVTVKDIHTGIYENNSSLLDKLGAINLTADNIPSSSEPISINLLFGDDKNRIFGYLKVDDKKIKDITFTGKDEYTLLGGLFSKNGEAPNVNLYLSKFDNKKTEYILNGDYRLGHGKYLTLNKDTNLELYNANIGAKDGSFNYVEFVDSNAAGLSLNGNSTVSNAFLYNKYEEQNIININGKDNEFKNVIGLNSEDFINLFPGSTTKFELNDDIQAAYRIKDNNIKSYVENLEFDGKKYTVATLNTDIISYTDADEDIDAAAAFKIDSATEANLVYKIKELKSDAPNTPANIELSGNGTLLLAVKSEPLGSNGTNKDLLLNLSFVGSVDKNPSAIITTQIKNIGSLNSYDNSGNDRTQSTFDKPIGHLVLPDCQAYGVNTRADKGYLESATILSIGNSEKKGHEFNNINVKDLNLYFKKDSLGKIDVRGYDVSHIPNESIVIRHNITDYSLLDANSNNEIFKNLIKPSLYILGMKNSLQKEAVSPTIVTGYVLDTISQDSSKTIIYTGKFSTIGADDKDQNHLQGTVVAGTDGAYKSVDNLYVGYTQGLNVDELQFGLNKNISAYLGNSSDIRSLSTLSKETNQNRYIHLSAKENNTNNNYVFGNLAASSTDDISVTYAINPTQYKADGDLISLQAEKKKTFTSNLFLNKNISDTDKDDKIDIGFIDNEFGRDDSVFENNSNNTLEFVLRPNSAGAVGADKKINTIGINNFHNVIDKDTGTKAALVFDATNEKGNVMDTNFAVAGLYLIQGQNKSLFDNIMIRNNANVTITSTEKNIIMSKAITVDGGTEGKASLTAKNYDSTNSNLRDAPIVLENGGTIAITQSVGDTNDSMLLIKSLVSNSDSADKINKLNLTKNSTTGQFLAVQEDINLQDTVFHFTNIDENQYTKLFVSQDNLVADIIAKDRITFGKGVLVADIIAKDRITFGKGVKGTYKLKLNRDTNLFAVASFDLEDNRNILKNINPDNNGVISFTGADITFDADLDGFNFSVNNVDNALDLNGIDENNKTKLRFNLSSLDNKNEADLALLNIKGRGQLDITQISCATFILDFSVEADKSKFDKYNFSVLKSSTQFNVVGNVDYTIINNSKAVNLFELSNNVSLTLSNSKITHHITSSNNTDNYVKLPNLIGDSYNSDTKEFIAGSKTVTYNPFIQNDAGGANGLNIANVKDAHIVISPTVQKDADISKFKLTNVLLLGGAKNTKITIEEPKAGNADEDGNIVIDHSQKIKISADTYAFVLEPNKDSLENNLSLDIQTKKAGSGAIHSDLDISKIESDKTVKLKIDEIKTDSDKLDISLRDSSEDENNQKRDRTIELQYSGNNLGTITALPQEAKNINGKLVSLNNRNIIAANANRITDNSNESYVTLKSATDSGDLNINQIDLAESVVKFDSSIKTLKIGDNQDEAIFKIGESSSVNGPMNFEFNFKQLESSDNFVPANFNDNGHECTLSLSFKQKNTNAINLNTLNFENSTVSLTNILADISQQTKVKDLRFGTDSEIFISTSFIEGIKINQLNNATKGVKIKTSSLPGITTLKDMKINLLSSNNVLASSFNMLESDKSIKSEGKNELAIDAVKVNDFAYDLSDSDTKLEVSKFIPNGEDSKLEISGSNASNTNISISMLPGKDKYKTVTLTGLGEDMSSDNLDASNGAKLTNIKSEQIYINNSYISHYSNNSTDDITFEDSKIALRRSDRIQGIDINFAGNTNKTITLDDGNEVEVGNIIILKDGTTNSTSTNNTLISGSTTISGNNLGLFLLGQGSKPTLQNKLKDLKICVASGDLTESIVPVAMNSSYKANGATFVEKLTTNGKETEHTFVSFAVDHARVEAEKRKQITDIVKNADATDKAGLKKLIDISRSMSKEWISSKISINSKNIVEDLAAAIDEEIKILDSKDESELTNSQKLLLKNLGENYNVDSRVKFLQNFFAYKSNSENSSSANNFNYSSKDTLDSFSDNISNLNNSADAVDSSENFESLVLASNEAVDGDDNEKGNIVSSASDSGKDSMNFRFGNFGINGIVGFKDTNIKKDSIKAISAGFKAQINRLRLGINIKYASLDVTYKTNIGKTNKMTMPEFGIDVGFVGIENNKNLLLVGGKFTAIKISGTMEDIRIANGGTKLGQTVKVKGDYKGTKLDGCLYAQYIAALSGEIGSKDSISFGIYGQIGVRKGWIDPFQENGGGSLDNLKYSESNMLSIPVLAMASLTVKKGDFSITPMIGASIDLKNEITGGESVFLIDDLGAQSTTTSKSFFRGLVGLSASVNVGSVKIKGGYMASINPNGVYNTSDDNKSTSTTETKTETTHTFSAGVEFSF